MFVIQSRVSTICVISSAPFAFCLMVPLFEKVAKKKAENNIFHCCVTLRKCFVFCCCFFFYDFKVVKSIKIEQTLLKNGQSHDAKNKRSEYFGTP